jgi:hypothetical protein
VVVVAAIYFAATTTTTIYCWQQLKMKGEKKKLN